MSTRLSAVCALIPPCALLLDVGCDHGLVAEYAVKSGTAKRVIASDISAGSLAKATKRLARYAAAETRLGDGLRVLRPGEEPDCIVIAGLGGHTVMDVLTGYTGSAALVLGAQKDVPALRTFLADNGWMITADGVVEDKGKFYDVIRAERGRMTLDRMQTQFGAFYTRPSETLLKKCLFDARRLKDTPQDVRDIEEVIKWQQR